MYYPMILENIYFHDKNFLYIFHAPSYLGIGLIFLFVCLKNSIYNNNVLTG